MSHSEFWSYVSTKAGADPVKTVFLFAPGEEATTPASVRAFAERSGWVDAVEADASLLVAPVAPDGWDACAPDLPMALYREQRNSFRAPSGESIPGRDGIVWTWEVMIELVGYGDGATFAANFQLAHPGFAAASVLVDGRASTLAAADEPSEHWLVPSPSNYALRNRDVPVCAWLMGEAADGAGMLEYLREVDGAAAESETRRYEGLETRVWANPAHPAQMVLETPGLTGADPRIARLGMGELFERVIRWKNAPDGTLEPHISKADFATGGRYRHASVSAGGTDYHYAVYLPAGMDEASVAGLPLVLSVHGRGEPTWIFAEKNGWERLADETRAFCVMLPDSPSNIWFVTRDAEALRAMIAETLETYALDAKRVYLTGFSNGAVLSYQMGTTYPELFAAVSPWNGPAASAILAMGQDGYVFEPGFGKRGVELPFWICYGDSDNKAPVASTDELAGILAANGCEVGREQLREGTEAYPVEAGYEAGERLSTRLFANGAGSERVGLTVVKNMPHGAIADEARAAWAFMSRFRRPVGSGAIEEVK